MIKACKRTPHRDGGPRNNFEWGVNQKEADQDVADEVNEEVDSRGMVTRSQKNDW